MRGQAWLLMFTAVLAGARARGQNWEAGAAIGFGFYHDTSLSSAAEAGRAGFGPRFALGAVVGRRLGRHFSVEGRYTFQDGDPEIVSGSTRASLDGDASSLLGEAVYSPRRREARVQPFVAAGAGIKWYRGTGTPAAVEPLAELATLHRATEGGGLVTYGGGVRFRVTERWWVRLDLRDYSTPFPTRVMMPATGVRLGGWLHDFVPMLGLSRGL